MQTIPLPQHASVVCLLLYQTAPSLSPRSKQQGAHCIQHTRVVGGTAAHTATTAGGMYTASTREGGREQITSPSRPRGLAAVRFQIGESDYPGVYFQELLCCSKYVFIIYPQTGRFDSFIFVQQCEVMSEGPRQRQQQRYRSSADRIMFWTDHHRIPSIS